jgi:hypothetical protein
LICKLKYNEVETPQEPRIEVPEQPPEEPPKIVPQATESQLRGAAKTFYERAQKPLLGAIDKALPGKKATPSKTAKPTGEFKADFDAGMEAIKQGADPNQVYLRLSDKWGKNPEYEIILYNKILKLHLGFP